MNFLYVRCPPSLPDRMHVCQQQCGKPRRRRPCPFAAYLKCTVRAAAKCGFRLCTSTSLFFSLTSQTLRRRRRRRRGGGGTSFCPLCLLFSAVQPGSKRARQQGSLPPLMATKSQYCRVERTLLCTRLPLPSPPLSSGGAPSLPPSLRYYSQSAISPHPRA